MIITIIIALNYIKFHPRIHCQLPLFIISIINPLNAELNPTCHLLALLGVHHFLHISRIKVKSLTLRLLKSYIYIYMECLFLMFPDHTRRRTTVGRTPLDELIAHPEESYRLWCIVVCDLETSRICTPYIYIYIYMTLEA
jgi:hypothetical protein